MSNETESIVVKKKRGRKKKEVQTANIPPQPDNDNPNVVEKPKSRRGRKTKNVTNTYVVDNAHTSLSDDENIIVKLNIQQKMDDRLDLFNPPQNALPNAYDGHMSAFESTPQMLSIRTQDAAASNHFDSCASTPVNSDKRIVELLKDFEMKSKICEWPQSTSIACYWCCHQFNTVPYGIPVKYYNGKYHVFGCFCSLECAVAYNFDSQESSDEIWERYNLINLLSRVLGYKPLVKPAPNKLSLKMFGGHLDIEDFRKYFDTNKVLSLNFPPMMTLTQQVEEINECDIQSEYRYIPIDKNRINMYKEKLTLKRSKPLTDPKQTLDHMMNLKIN
jgi:hypothetical protein